MILILRASVSMYKIMYVSRTDLFTSPNNYCCNKQSTEIMFRVFKQRTDVDSKHQRTSFILKFYVGRMCAVD